MGRDAYTIVRGLHDFKAACDRLRGRSDASPHLIIGISRYASRGPGTPGVWVVLLSRSGDACVLVSAHRFHVDADAQVQRAKTWVERAGWATDPYYIALCRQLAVQSDRTLPDDVIADALAAFNRHMERTP